MNVVNVTAANVNDNVANVNAANVSVDNVNAANAIVNANVTMCPMSM